MSHNSINPIYNSFNQQFPIIKTIFISDNNNPKINRIIIVESLFEQCNICLLFYTEVYYTDKCRHYLCKTCLTAWSKIKRQCPVCKRYYSRIFKK